VSSVAVRVLRDLSEIDGDAWDAVQAPGGFYASTPWLRHADATADLPPRYLAATRNGRLLGGVPVYPLGIGSPFVFCRTDNVIDAIHQERLGEPADWVAGLMPTLACGGRNPASTRIGVDAKLDGAERRAVVDAVVAAADREARDAGLRSVAFLYVDEDDTLLRDALRADGSYVELVSDQAYLLELSEGDVFGGYLAGVRRKRRHAIAREQRTLAVAGVSYQTQPLTDELVERIAALELALYARHGTAADPSAFAGVLHSIARNTGDTALVVTAHVAGNLAGFVLVFAYAGELYARQTGFDYAVVGRLPVYFGLVYNELVRLAGELGMRRIYYSTGSGAVKRSRGCNEVAQFAYVRSDDPELRARLAALACYS
jgi:predicted N-acyltransferase